MPIPVMAHPRATAPALACAAMFCGRLKTPAPTMEPITSEMRAPSPSFLSISNLFY